MSTPAIDPLRVVLIGPECTGKTWLAGELAAYYGVPWSPEYARAFVDAHPRPVRYEDVEAIGLGQLESEERALEAARASRAGLVVHDTDLVSTMVYSQHYFGRCPAWIEDKARARRADLYLLHEIDVPWVADLHQRADPERRQALGERFASTLGALGARVAPVVGGWEERRQRATVAIERALAQRR